LELGQLGSPTGCLPLELNQRAARRFALLLGGVPVRGGLFITGTRGGEFRFDLRLVLAQSGEEGLLLALGGCQLDSARLLQRVATLSADLAFLGRSGGCLGFAPRIASAI